MNKTQIAEVMKIFMAAGVVLDTGKTINAQAGYVIKPAHRLFVKGLCDTESWADYLGSHRNYCQLFQLQLKSAQKKAERKRKRRVLKADVGAINDFTANPEQQARARLT